METLTPSNATDTGAILDSLRDLIAGAKQDGDFRERLLTSLRAAVQELESPHERFWRMLVEPHAYAIVRTAIELELFQNLHESGPLSADVLADKSGADHLLIVRVVRVLTAMGLVREVGVQTYENSAGGTVLATDVGMRGALNFMFDVAGQAAMKVPSTLAMHGWRNPSADPITFKAAFGAEHNAFTWLGSHPNTLNDFNRMMQAQRFNRREWYDFFPVQESLLDGYDDGVLLVDVGGAQGYELECFRKRFPQAKGHMILQDLPHVIDSIQDLNADIERVKHDFFTEQPVKGARAYYLRSIFHDWPDDACRSILRNLKPAMRAGYSKLIINDWIIPEQGAPLYPSLLDINMLALFSSMERTTSQFRELLESEGFEIIQVHTIPNTEGCIEAMVKSE